MNNETKKRTVRLFGSIGNDIDGSRFANDLAELDGKVDQIDLHINSPGGSVDQGYSIVSVMLSMKSNVDVYIVGIAASMAAVIAVCGNRVKMYDYSKLMIHDPYFEGTAYEKLTDKQKKSLDNITDSLRTILSRRGKTKEEIAMLMREETWFSAQEAKAAGLIDEVISTKRKNEFSGLSSDDIYSRISAEYPFNKSKNNNMDLLTELASLLGLNNPTEEEIIQAVKKLIDGQPSEGVEEKLGSALRRGIINQDSYADLLEMGNKTPDSLNIYLSKLEKEYESKLNEKVDNYFKEIRSKLYYVNYKDKEELKILAKNNFDLFVRLTNILPDRKPLSEEIKDTEKSGKNSSVWTLDDYRKYAPEELKKNPQLYERLINKEIK
ncbi:head maturation protease, ClpP-related [Parabacteroides sp. Marseille-P3160]|uniref:head maturation protease, ClpP-related n=1 Tax=Parabacteroides sp. Marseille-P3160 TaxID=1917887 RepID=UPI0011194D11|nr:head maturation protease, ClpP-related [Parabacteroides sp. Marseille-P3160]